MIDDILRLFVQNCGPAKLTVSLGIDQNISELGHESTLYHFIGSNSGIYISSLLIRNLRPLVPVAWSRNSCRVLAVGAVPATNSELKSELTVAGLNIGQFSLQFADDVDFSECGAALSGAVAGIIIHAVSNAALIHTSETNRREFENLNAIVESTNNLIIRTDKLGFIVWVNRAFETFTGYALQEVLGKTPGSVLAGPETEPGKTAKLRQAIRDVRPLKTKITNYTKSGEVYKVSIYLNPIYDRNDNHVGFMSIQQNISDEEYLKQQLSEAVKDKALYAELAAHNPVPSFRYAVGSLKLEYANAAGMKCLKNLEKSPNDLADWNTFLVFCSNAPVDFAKELAFSNANYICDVTITEGNSFNVYWHDVTQLRKTDMALSKALDKLIDQKKLYEKILDNIPVEIALLDKEKKYRFVNREAIKNEHIRKWIIGKTDFEYVTYRNRPASVAERRTAYLDQVFSGGSHPEWIEQQQLPDGTSKVIERKYHKYADSEFAIGYGLDITRPITHANELKTKNDELRKINSELNFFVYSVSHNLRSPLLSVKGLIEILQEERNQGDGKVDVFEYVDFMSTAIQRLDETIVDILNYFRNTRSELDISKIDIQAVCQNIFKDLKFFHSHIVGFSMSAQVHAHFFSDAQRLTSLINNLISNAVKYADLKKPNPFVKVSIEIDERQLVFVVEDNGEGIAIDIQERVFEMFFRGSSNSVGSGLGLFITKEIVAKLEGTLQLESTPGIGTKFTAVIPNRLPALG